MKDRIICLIGESGSGKSTIAELLAKEGYNYIQSYTTRKQRFKGEKGHIFVNHVPIVLIADNVPKNAILNHGIIAHTYFDNNFYWATKEQYQGKGTSLYIIDPSGVDELRTKAKDAEIICIYIKVNRKERMRRMLMERDPQSVETRLAHDDKVFEIIQCDYVVNNSNNISDAVNLIKQVIGGI